MTTERLVRPLLYIRLRLHLGGEAEYIDDLLERELESMTVALETLRAASAPEWEVEQQRDQIVHVINAKKDITTGLLDRGMEFLKVRVYRGGQADTLYDILLDEQDNLMNRLGKLRESNFAEDSPEIEEVRTNLHHCINVIRDLTSNMIELAGPDADPLPPDERARQRELSHIRRFGPTDAHPR